MYSPRRLFPPCILLDRPEYLLHEEHVCLFRDDESKDTVFTFVGTSKFVKGGTAEEASNGINSIVDKHILDKLEQEEEKPKPSHKKQSVKKVCIHKHVRTSTQ